MVVVAVAVLVGVTEADEEQPRAAGREDTQGDAGGDGVGAIVAFAGEGARTGSPRSACWRRSSLPHI